MDSDLNVWLNQQEFVQYFKETLDRKVCCADRLEFINGWFILLIISDIFTITGSIIKIGIESKVLHPCCVPFYYYCFTILFYAFYTQSFAKVLVVCDGNILHTNYLHVLIWELLFFGSEDGSIHRWETSSEYMYLLHVQRDKKYLTATDCGSGLN